MIHAVLLWVWCRDHTYEIAGILEAVHYRQYAVWLGTNGLVENRDVVKVAQCLNVRQFDKAAKLSGIANNPEFDGYLAQRVMQILHDKHTLTRCRQIFAVFTMARPLGLKDGKVRAVEVHKYGTALAGIHYAAMGTHSCGGSGQYHQ